MTLDSPPPNKNKSNAVTPGHDGVDDLVGAMGEATTGAFTSVSNGIFNTHKNNKRKRDDDETLPTEETDETLPAEETAAPDVLGEVARGFSKEDSLEESNNQKRSWTMESYYAHGTYTHKKDVRYIEVGKGKQVSLQPNRPDFCNITDDTWDPYVLENRIDEGAGYWDQREVKTLKTVDKFDSTTPVERLLLSNQRWPPETWGTAHNCVRIEEQRECCWSGGCTEGQMRDLKVRFFQTVAFIDTSQGNLNLVVNHRVLAVGNAQMKRSIGSGIEVCAVLVVTNLTLGCDTTVEESKYSLAERLRQANMDEVLFNIVKHDFLFFRRFMNFKGCGYPLDVFEFKNGLNAACYKPLKDSVDSWKKKARDFGVWSEQYVIRYIKQFPHPTEPGRKLKITQSNKAMVKGIYYPIALLLSRLVSGFYFPANMEYITKKQKTMLDDPMLPLDKAELVKQMWTEDDDVE